jgi:hypothetical protein
MFCVSSEATIVLVRWARTQHRTPKFPAPSPDDFKDNIQHILRPTFQDLYRMRARAFVVDPL